MNNDSATIPADNRYVWQRYLDVKNIDVSAYHQHVNPELLGLFAHAPRKMIDVGCAGGMLAKLVKARYPAVHITGFEMNQAAAALAADNVDRIFCGKFEDFDLPDEGIPHGSIDTIVLADVLEHIYDPWSVMVRLKPFLTADAQMIISLPNTRNIILTSNLIDKGQWTYDDRGLLDVTHIRFFTLSEIDTFLQQTGYRIEQVAQFLDPNLQALYEQFKNKPKISFSVGRMTLDDITPRELGEFCTLQFFIRARPASESAQQI